MSEWWCDVYNTISGLKQTEIYSQLQKKFWDPVSRALHPKFTRNDMVARMAYYSKAAFSGRFTNSLKRLKPAVANFQRRQIIDVSSESNYNKSESSLLGPSTSGSARKNKEPSESVYITDDEDDVDLEGAEGDEEEVDYKDLGVSDAELSNTGMVEPLDVVLPPEFIDSAPVDKTSSAPPPLVPIQSNPINAPGVSTKQYPTTMECDLFGEYVSKHLQELPLEMALKLQCGIQNLVMKTRLEYARQNPDEAPLMVKQEVREDEEEEQSSRRPTTNKTNTNEKDETRTGKRPLDPQPTEAKRQKLDTNNPTGTKSATTATSQTQKTKSKRTDCVVFAEQIAVQLEQLPEELALQLQSDIYAMITQAAPEFSKEDPPGRIVIKAEAIEVSPTEIMEDYYEDYKN